MREPLIVLANEVPPIVLRRETTCVLLQDLHAPFTDPVRGALVARAVGKYLARELDEYLDILMVVAPSIARLVAAVRESGIRVVYSCLGFRPPDSPSPFQTATGWIWELDGPDGQFPPAWAPEPGEPVFSKPGWGALSNPALYEYLLQLGATNILLAGSLFNYGIRQTCVELNDRGFQCLVISDAVAAITRDHHGYTSSAIGQGLVKLRSTSEIVDLLETMRRQQFVII